MCAILLHCALYSLACYVYDVETRCEAHCLMTGYGAGCYGCSCCVAYAVLGVVGIDKDGAVKCLNAAVAVRERADGCFCASVHCHVVNEDGRLLVGCGVEGYAELLVLGVAEVNSVLLPTAFSEYINRLADGYIVVCLVVLQLNLDGVVSCGSAVVVVDVE